jgi:hypothetical protein
MGFEIRIEKTWVWLKSLTNEKLEWLTILEIILHKKLIHTSQLSTLRLKDVYFFNVKFNQFKWELNLSRFWTSFVRSMLEWWNLSRSKPPTQREINKVNNVVWAIVKRIVHLLEENDDFDNNFFYTPLGSLLEPISMEIEKCMWIDIGIKHSQILLTYHKRIVH